jgi:hypothetical protein
VGSDKATTAQLAGYLRAECSNSLEETGESSKEQSGTARWWRIRPLEVEDTATARWVEGPHVVTQHGPNQFVVRRQRPLFGRENSHI